MTAEPIASCPQAAPSMLCRDCLALFAAGNGACPRCASPRTVSHPELACLPIAHIDCDAFYAAIEKRDDPSLRDKPVIVGHAGGRGVVTTACYVARRFGLRSAMPMFRALQLCPDAVVIPPAMDKYKRVSRQIRAILLTATPVIEPVSLDEAYLDLADGVRLKQALPAAVLAGIALAVEREVGITISIGLSFNKFLAKLASDLDKPRGFALIGRAEAMDFLAPLPVRRILGVGAATARKLEEIGIPTIGALRAFPEPDLVARFGSFGRRLAQFSRGEDDREVIAYRPAKSISAETTFDSDLRRAEQLAAVLRPLCDRVADRLARAAVAGRTVVLKLKTSDFQVLTRHHRLADPTRRAEVIFQVAVPLITREANGRAFRLIGIGMTDLCSASLADPPDLFEALNR
jgi:DNA polymerase IV